jgi:hypothetical protein
MCASHLNGGRRKAAGGDHHPFIGSNIIPQTYESPKFRDIDGPRMILALYDDENRILSDTDSDRDIYLARNFRMVSDDLVVKRYSGALRSKLCVYSVNEFLESLPFRVRHADCHLSLLSPQSTAAAATSFRSANIHRNNT